MAFEVISFLIGVGAGALTGSLAAMLHGLENVANLQERVRQVTREVQRLKTSDPTNNDQQQDPKVELNALERELDSIHEEIRRMYRRASR
jgi:gas vesicle protein